eukprot:TRINITY_DN7186_c0_g1_i1.p2 TRINITY_DN7186_c0_g1~~TRINITY_DN7186_c0_g1_i1.p2  ORF type:complete len:61 (+),score=5.06 TRINITY_DN7186_c0_g1_i1:224-406(+)
MPSSSELWLESKVNPLSSRVTVDIELLLWGDWFVFGDDVADVWFREDSFCFLMIIYTLLS